MKMGPFKHHGGTPKYMKVIVITGESINLGTGLYRQTKMFEASVPVGYLGKRIKFGFSKTGQGL